MAPKYERIKQVLLLEVSYSCKEQGGGLCDPYEYLPTWDILWLYDLRFCMNLISKLRSTGFSAPVFLVNYSCKPTKKGLHLQSWKSSVVFWFFVCCVGFGCVFFFVLFYLWWGACFILLVSLVFGFVFLGVFGFGVFFFSLCFFCGFGFAFAFFFIYLITLWTIGTCTEEELFWEFVYAPYVHNSTCSVKRKMIQKYLFFFSFMNWGWQNMTSS